MQATNTTLRDSNSFPEQQVTDAEAQLAKLRASVVNMHALAGVAATLGGEAGLGTFLYLGRGEEMTGGRDKTSILADATEALIGAVFLQHGLETARGLVHRLFDGLLQGAPLLGAGLDWTTSLQELTASAELGVPEYRFTKDAEEALAQIEAEQKAAELAWRTLTAEAASGNTAAAS